jgi:hypothetical protein
MKTKFENLEQMIEPNFNDELFEKKAYDVSSQINNADDFIYLANMVRWAEFDDEDKGLEIAGNIIDRAIELSVKQKDKEKLEEIVFELEAGLEMDERANEVKSIIENM